MNVDPCEAMRLEKTTVNADVDASVGLVDASGTRAGHPSVAVGDAPNENAAFGVVAQDLAQAFSGWWLSRPSHRASHSVSGFRWNSIVWVLRGGGGGSGGAYCGLASSAPSVATVFTLCCTSRTLAAPMPCTTMSPCFMAMKSGMSSAPGFRFESLKRSTHSRR